ncbi:LuxR family transcriptional regulator [Mycobacterium paraense]|uniref:LuxR family transcriptional regulator n=1 Tax=Mycobacterium paraense TaxID=767916 RepID=A0A1X2AKD0_9MYCO|nr:LuxR family transcriptional regulator [Mycobacterium paraense]ORW51817.1 LuxR family transcriptional regulator [Mycobacterium paraense]
MTRAPRRPLPAERLLEREQVLAELGALARGVRRGAGRVVLLRGEAGIGKTAVLRRFGAALDPAVQVLSGGCDPLAAPRPLGPVLDALAGLGPEAAQPVGAAIDAGDTAALYRRLLALLRGGHRWVWIIEDAHWADGATLDLLRFLSRRIGSLPLLLVVSYRDDELDAQHPLAVVLGDVANCGALNRIGLEPLSRDAVAVLAAGSGVNADRLHDLTGGNPFFVTEVVAAGVDASGRNLLPRSVFEAVWGRLARLSPGARDTAQAVAVCGPRAEPALVQKVCPAADAGLAECLDAGVLVAEGDAVGFRHELARRATLERIDDYQHKALHRRALAALAAPPINPNTFAALAFHADQAGDHEAAVRFGVAAAQRAGGLGAHRQAADLYALTLRHAHTAPAEQKVVWLEQHALATGFCGLAEASVSSWREASAMRHALGDRLAEAEDLRWLSFMLWPMGRLREAGEAGRASLRLAQDSGACPQLAWALANVAEQGVFDFDPDAADYAARAIAVGTELGDDAVVARARGFAALARPLHTDTGWEELEAVWRGAMATDARRETAGILGGFLCVVAALHYDLDRADGYIADFLAYCRDHDIYTYEAIGTVATALVGLHRGHWARARTCAEDVLTRPGLPVVHRLLARLTLALIHARRGEQPATSPLDEAAASCELDDVPFFPVRAARAEAAWLAGDDDTARGEAQSALRTSGRELDPWVTWQLHRWVQLPGGTPTPVDNPINPLQLEVSGDWQGAAAEWTRRGCPYEAAIAQLGGDIPAVEAALATFRGLGATAAARRARQRLTQLRGPTRRTRRTDLHADPDGLSRREREVLTLIAAGHSDADIATKLSLSRKTVGHHVESILTKLGADNRTQAAAHARQVQQPG